VAIAFPPPGLLALADGTVFRGVSVGAPGVAVGEVVFNTAMSGYQEILTDPSYHQQIVTLTYPHVGNTGVTPDDDEADGPQVAGLIVRDVPRRPSSWRMAEPLDAWLTRSGVVALAEIDTRRLTRHLRERGAQAGCIVADPSVGEDEAIARARAFAGLSGADLAREVTLDAAAPWREGSVRWETGEAAALGPDDGPHVVAYDFGVKRNILRMLVDRGCRVTVVPATTTADEALALKPDGVFLSNGPGDPEPVTYAQEAIRRFVGADLPVFGICLGHQLLCLALGAESRKMKFGHHGANHPVRDHDADRVLISSQNHGFAIDAVTLPQSLRVTHTSLFDGSLQGVEHETLPVFGFQGHPEASPGPHEVAVIFDRFVGAVRERAGRGDDAQA